MDEREREWEGGGRGEGGREAYLIDCLK